MRPNFNTKFIKANQINMVAQTVDKNHLEMFAHFLDFLNVILYFKINGYVYVDYIISLFLVLTRIPPPASHTEKKHTIGCFLEIYSLVWSLDLANQIGLLLSPFSFLAQQVPQPT